MFLSLILTNCLFCGLSVSVLIPLLRHPNTLIYKRGFPIFLIIGLIFIKLLIPHEFSFTHTLASKNILPIIYNITHFNLIKNITVGVVFMGIWFSVILLLLLRILLNHRKLMRVLRLVPTTQNQEITHILNMLCTQNKISKVPRIIQLNLNTSPFITGLFKPIIVLPTKISTNEAQFIIHHELTHLAYHHILIRACIEMIFIFYWWNPIIWIVRKELIRSLEIQADINVMKELPNNVRFLYLETLIKQSRHISNKDANNLALSFSMRNGMVEYRIRSALKIQSYSVSKKNLFYYFSFLLISITVFLLSFTFTFESYEVNIADVKGSFSVDTKTDYFVSQNNKSYDLYINGKNVGTLSDIPEELSELPIHTK